MKTLVLLSGGLDSSTLLYAARGTVKAISFDYGQRHSKELDSARAIVASVPWIEHVIVPLQGLGAILNRGVLTAGGEVPEGHYAAESMKQTVVPNRNMIMLAVAAGHAMANGFDRVSFAAHGGDHAIYPDCRPEFFRAVAGTVELADWSRVEIEAPFINSTKAEIVKLGDGLSVPWDKTWSCYKGGEIHCGKCGTCVERREAFSLAGVTDPTRYE